MARIPVTLSAFGRLLAGALRATPFALMIACTHPAAVSMHGFRLNPAERPDLTPELDDAFLDLANRATKTYTELSYVLLAVDSLHLRIEFNAQGDSVTGNLIRVQQSSNCLANGALLPIWGALIGDLLGRDVSGAVLGTAAELIDFCPEQSLPNDKSN